MRGLSFSGNVGYNYALPNNWFIEPSAGIVVSRVKVDPLNVTGTLILPASFTPGITFPGQLRINDIDSTLGRLSLRGGTTIVSGNMIWQPFAIASVYHEFQGSVTASFNGDGRPLQPASLGQREYFIDEHRNLRSVRSRSGRTGGQHRMAGLRSRRLPHWRQHQGYSLNGRRSLSIYARRDCCSMYTKAPR
jgi:hypothetical protein